MKQYRSCFQITAFLLLLVMLWGCGKGEQQTVASEPQQKQATAAEASVENPGRPGSTAAQLNNALANLPGIPAGTDETRNTARMSRSATIVYPVPEVTADETIEVQGKTKAGNRVFIKGKETAVNPAGQFKQNILLQPGENRLEITTLGKKGMADKQELVVQYQPPAPKLLVIAPDRSESETITLSGQTGPDCIVYVNSNRTLPDKTGKFTQTVKLKPGSNAIRVVAADDRGGQASETKKISFLPPEPRLVVIVPEETTSKQLNISGITDENAVLVVYVNDVKTSINNQNGIFSGTVQLQEGLNNITVQVANKWGKIKKEHKNVYCEIINNTSGL